MKTPQQSFRFTRWYGERSIGFRLALCFAAILSLMTIGIAVAFWQLRANITQAERLHQVDRMAEDVLRLHTDVLTLSENWHGPCRRSRSGASWPCPKSPARA